MGFFNSVFAQELLGTNCGQVTAATTEDNTINIIYRGKNNVPYGRDASSNPQHFNLIVFHYPYTSCQPEASVNSGLNYSDERGGYFGYHFYIAQNGDIYQGAPMNKRTNHVFQPESRGIINYDNNSSVGITLVCGENGPPQSQVDAAVKLGHALQVAYNIPSNRIFGHGEIQNNRETREGSPAQQMTRSKSPTSGKFTINYTLENGQKTSCSIDGPVPAGCTGNMCNVSIPAASTGVGSSPKLNDSNDFSPGQKDLPYQGNHPPQNSSLPQNGLPVNAAPTTNQSNPASPTTAINAKCSDTELVNLKLKINYYAGIYSKKYRSKYGNWADLLNKNNYSFSFEYFFAKYIAREISVNINALNICLQKQVLILKNQVILK